MTLATESIWSEEDLKITSDIFDINLTNDFRGKPSLKIFLYSSTIEELIYERKHRIEFRKIKD